MTTKCRACTREMTEWAQRNCEGFCTQCFHTTSVPPKDKLKALEERRGESSAAWMQKYRESTFGYRPLSKPQ